MKNMYVLWVFLFATSIAKAQNLPNSSFETWKESGREAPFNWEEPNGWKSTNGQTEWTSAGISKTTTAQDGNYAAKIKSVMISNGWYSVLCNGDPKAINDFSAPGLNILTGGTPINTKPAKLNGFYKFNAPTAGDSAYAIVILKKYNETLKIWDTVAFAEKILAPTANFIPFELNLNYKSLTIEADSAVVAFYSSNPKNPAKPENFTKLGELTIDNISFSEATNIKTKEKSSGIFLYPNPVSHVLFVTLNKEMAIKQNHYKILSTEGKVISSGRITAEARTFSLEVANFAAGLYWFTVHNEDGTVFTSQISIIH